MKILAALALTTSTLITFTGSLWPQPVAAATDVPVLGSPAHNAPLGRGWGTAHPRYLHNGGVASGEVFALTWLDWGATAALGSGKTWLYRPEGGYYGRPGKIVLRAKRLGTCPDGTVAYTRLEYRVATRPSAPVVGPWRAWSGGRGDICEP